MLAMSLLRDMDLAETYVYNNNKKFITHTYSHIKHEFEVLAVTRWPDGVC